MADIKSAYEIAMEKIKEIESATPEERMKWKFVPKGEELAGKYMKDDINLMPNSASTKMKRENMSCREFRRYSSGISTCRRTMPSRKIIAKRWTASN